MPGRYSSQPRPSRLHACTLAGVSSVCATPTLHVHDGGREVQAASRRGGVETRAWHQMVVCAARCVHGSLLHAYTQRPSLRWPHDLALHGPLVGGAVVWARAAFGGIGWMSLGGAAPVVRAVLEQATGRRRGLVDWHGQPRKNGRHTGSRLRRTPATLTRSGQYRRGRHAVGGGVHAPAAPPSIASDAYPPGRQPVLASRRRWLKDAGATLAPTDRPDGTACCGVGLWILVVG